MRHARAAEDYRRVLAGSVDRIPNRQQFSSELPGISKILILKGGAKDNPTAMAHITYGSAGRSRTDTFSINKRGELNGAIPKELSATMSREDLYDEVLKDIESMDLDYLIETSEPIIMPGEGPATTPLSQREINLAGLKEDLNDAGRLEFIKEIKGKLLTTVPKLGGFNNYSITVFPRYAILESPQVGNALYVFNFAKELDLERYGRDALSKKIDSMTPEEKNALVHDLPWPLPQPFTKTQLRGLEDTTRIPHAGDWRTKLTDDLEQRNKA